MTKENRYGMHSSLLLIAVCFSSVLLSFPKGEQHGGLAAIILSVILTAAACVFEARIIDFAASKTGSGATAPRVILTAALLPFALTAVFSFFELLAFISTKSLPDSSRLAVAALLMVVLFLVVRSSDNAIFKFTLVAFTICAVASAVVFLLSLKLIKVAEITAEPFKWQQFLIYTLKLTGKLSVPVLSAVAFITVTKGRLSNKRAFFSVFFGAVGAAAILLQSVLLLGAELCDTLVYPYISAVGVISTGSLFSRLDGIAYMTVFFTYIIKITVSVKAVILTVKLLAKKKS